MFGLPGTSALQQQAVVLAAKQQHQIGGDRSDDSIQGSLAYLLQREVGTYELPNLVMAASSVACSCSTSSANLWSWMSVTMPHQ